MFSVIISTRNNLKFFKLAVDNIRRHSQYEHETIRHVSEDSDCTQKDHQAREPGTRTRPMEARQLI